jgi:hypothetical protein
LIMGAKYATGGPGSSLTIVGTHRRSGSAVTLGR